MATPLLPAHFVPPYLPCNSFHICNHLSAPLAALLISSTPATRSTCSPSEARLLRTPGPPADELKPHLHHSDQPRCLSFLKFIMLAREEKRDSETDCHRRKLVFPKLWVYQHDERPRHLPTSLPNPSNLQPIPQAPPALPELGYLDQQPCSAILLLLTGQELCVLSVTSHNFCCSHTLRRHSPINRKAGEDVLHGLLLHKPLLIPSCLGLAGTSALFCRITGSSSFPVFSQVSLSDYSCMQGLSQPSYHPFCSRTDSLMQRGKCPLSLLFSTPLCLHQVKAFQQHLAAAYVVLFPACLALYRKDKPFWR